MMCITPINQICFHAAISCYRGFYLALSSCISLTPLVWAGVGLLKRVLGYFS